MFERKIIVHFAQNEPVLLITLTGESRQLMKIWTFEGGYDNNLSYIFSDGISKDAAVVDAAVPSKDLQATIGKHNLKPQYLLITHTHGDHITYMDEYLSSFPGIGVCVFKQSVRWSNQRNVTDGDIIHLGNLAINVLHTPGHYSDSICYLADGALFTGDTLFVGRTGRTVSMGSNTRELYRSIYNKILTLNENTVIYPGHNYGNVPNITIAENRKISPLLQASNEDDFVRRMDEYERSRLSS